jgi:hypothetical protein
MRVVEGSRNKGRKGGRVREREQWGEGGKEKEDEGAHTHTDTPLSLSMYHEELWVHKKEEMLPTQWTQMMRRWKRM